MLAVQPGPSFADAVARYHTKIAPHEQAIQRVTDLLTRLDSDATELAATVHFATTAVQSELGRTPSDLEALQRIQHWKRRRRPPSTTETSWLPSGAWRHSAGSRSPRPTSPPVTPPPSPDRLQATIDATRTPSLGSGERRQMMLRHDLACWAATQPWRQLPLLCGTRLGRDASAPQQISLPRPARRPPLCPLALTPVISSMAEWLANSPCP